MLRLFCFYGGLTEKLRFLLFCFYGDLIEKLTISLVSSFEYQGLSLRFPLFVFCSFCRLAGGSFPFFFLELRN